ncbi:MAG: opine dehydrogenase, partial [Acidobacteria bacterium]|nr:opine dehydrogenase [Acidobacteriota bacterium]NIT09987.1 opine dehydrogenase [Acidobacteriota bacterium]
MRIAVLGAGAGGTATAFDHAAQGHDVRVFDVPAFPDNVAAIAAAGGVHADGAISGFAPVSSAGHDIDEALEGATLIYVVGPAFSTEPFGELVAGRLQAGQTVVVSPGSCGGALAFARAAGLDIGGGIGVAETSTLPYAVRLIEPGRVRIFLKLKGGVLLAGLPSGITATVLELVAGVYPTMEAASGVMQTTLQNANPVIHPAVTLANAARIELTAGDFLFYEDGVSDGTGRLIEAVDHERIAIG